MEKLNKIQIEQIREAISRLKDGEVIAYPTETFFGLGVDPYNLGAVSKLLELKERFLNEGVSLIASSINAVNNLAIKVANEEKRIELQNKFWPGPLTLVVGLGEVNFSKQLLASDGSIALRVSSSQIALELAAGIGGLITATSANPHSKPPATTVSEVRKYFPKLYALEGVAQQSKASTIIDVQKFPFKILREGVVSKDELKGYL